MKKNNSSITRRRKWLDGDVEGFVNYWDASLKNNQEVAIVLAFYAEDDE